MSIIGKLMKPIIDVATLPVDIVRDVVTMGGVADDSGSSTIKKLEKLKKDLEDYIKGIRNG